MVEANDWLSVNTTPVQRKKRLTWTEEEHRLFLIGMEKYGKGYWKSIASKVVKSKTATQVASHAQKYFKRQEFPKKERKRASIHDITLENIDLVSRPNDLHAHNVTLQHVQEPQQAQAINQNWVFPPLHAHNFLMHQLQEPQQAQEISQNWVFPPLHAHNFLMHQLQEPQQAQEISQNWVFPPLHAHNVPMHQLQEPQQEQEISQNWVFPPLHAYNVPMLQLQEQQQQEDMLQSWVMPNQMGGFGFGDAFG